jgi:LacI family transcriptional regulator
MTRIPKVVLLIESSRETGRALLRGVANFCHHHGPWSFYWEPGGMEQARPTLRALKADGIILRDVEPVEEVLAEGIPAVVVGHRRKEFSGMVNVVTDSETIARMAAEHLMNCGFRHFAFCGYSDTSWSEWRSDSFTRRVEQAGFQVHRHFVPQIETEGAWRKVRNSILRWLRPLPKPVGMMGCNDDLAKEVVEACTMAGLTVPDDVAVIGADNDEVVCGICNPPMSSVAINFERAGYEAAQALSAMMRGTGSPPPRILVNPTHVVPRRSTDILAVEDSNLAKALQFIRDHARGGVTVAAAAKAAGLSRRVLEKRFRRILNRSALEEIRRVRTDLIARMLVETTLPVAEIAESLGFNDLQHVARYFRAGKGLSPLAYRKSLSSNRSG